MSHDVPGRLVQRWNSRSKRWIPPPLTMMLPRLLMELQRRFRRSIIALSDWQTRVYWDSDPSQIQQLASVWTERTVLWYVPEMLPGSCGGLSTCWSLVCRSSLFVSCDQRALCALQVDEMEPILSAFRARLMWFAT